MQSHTFGSEEGFDATHEAMMKYINEELYSGHARGAFHTSLNLHNITMLMNTLEFVMMYAGTVKANVEMDTAEAQQIQAVLDWTEQAYRDLAKTAGVELI